MTRKITVNVDWSRVIQGIRKAERCSDEHISRSIGCSHATISKLKSYENKNPLFETAMALLNWYVDVVDQHIPLLNGKTFEVSK